MNFSPWAPGVKNIGNFIESGQVKKQHVTMEECSVNLNVNYKLSAICKLKE